MSLGPLGPSQILHRGYGYRGKTLTMQRTRVNVVCLDNGNLARPTPLNVVD